MVVDVVLVPDPASAAFEKNVVIVIIPVTELPAVMWKFVLLALVARPCNFRSPTLMIRESRPSLEKKSSTEK